MQYQVKYKMKWSQKASKDLKKQVCKVSSPKIAMIIQTRKIELQFYKWSIRNKGYLNSFYCYNQSLNNYVELISKIMQTIFQIMIK